MIERVESKLDRQRERERDYRRREGGRKGGQTETDASPTLLLLHLLL